MAENATHNLHNLLTLRGALVRDPRAWSGYLTEAIDTFADRADVVFASHHWPTWGRDGIVEFLSLQRDLYAYLHDQTLRLLNQGHTGVEIAEMFRLPPALERAWHARGYYGSVSHNVKAIYQRYMGWFDGNPARLWPHPPEALGPRYVAAMGGIDRVVDLAQQAFDSGDYRWAATLLDHAMFTDGEHVGARELYADTLEQLAYGAENATWRNFFLSGATELRDGNFGTAGQVTSPTMLAQLTPEQIFDGLAIRVNGPRSWGPTSPSTSPLPTRRSTIGSPCATACWCNARCRRIPRPRPLRCGWPTRFGYWRWRRGLRLAGSGAHRRSGCAAVVGGSARRAGPRFQHRHAVAPPLTRRRSPPCPAPCGRRRAATPRRSARAETAPRCTAGRCRRRTSATTPSGRARRRRAGRS